MSGRGEKFENRLVKSLVLFMMLFIPLFQLSASPWEIGASLSFRESTMTTFPYLIGVEGKWNSIIGRFSFQGNEMLDLTLGYDLSVGKTICNEFRLHTEWVPLDKGGFSDISYEFHQRFSWKYGGIGYRAGVGASIAYSVYSKTPAYSIEPLLGVEGFLTLGSAEIEAYLRLNSEIEDNFRSVPIAGLKVTGRLDEHNEVRLEGWMKHAEYLFDPWFMITAWGVRASYIYKGD